MGEHIEGCFVMQAQPAFTHQVIAGNVERLLDDASGAFLPGLVALQAPAIDMCEAGILGAQPTYPMSVCSKLRK